MPSARTIFSLTFAPASPSPRRLWHPTGLTRFSGRLATSRAIPRRSRGRPGRMELLLQRAVQVGCNGRSVGVLTGRQHLIHHSDGQHDGGLSRIQDGVRRLKHGKFFCARELIVSGSYDCADRRHARWVVLTCIQVFVDSGQKRGSGRRILGGHHELHRLPGSGRLPTFRAGLF